MSDIYKHLAMHLQYTFLVGSVFLISFLSSFDIAGLPSSRPENQAFTDKRHSRSNAGPQKPGVSIEIVRYRSEVN